MAHGMPEQQQSGQEGSMDFLWIMAAGIGAALLIWYFGKSYITTAIFYARFYEITAINFVLDPFTKLFQLVGITPPQLELDQWLSYFQQNLGQIHPDLQSAQ